MFPQIRLPLFSHAIMEFNDDYSEACECGTSENEALQACIHFARTFELISILNFSSHNYRLQLIDLSGLLVRELCAISK